MVPLHWGHSCSTECVDTLQPSLFPRPQPSRSAAKTERSSTVQYFSWGGQRVRTKVTALLFVEQKRKRIIMVIETSAATSFNVLLINPERRRDALINGTGDRLAARVISLHLGRARRITRGGWCNHNYSLSSQELQMPLFCQQVVPEGNIPPVKERRCNKQSLWRCPPPPLLKKLFIIKNVGVSVGTYTMFSSVHRRYF